jgi:hypothetical protein
MEEMQKGIQSFAAAYIALKLPFCYSKTSPQLLILLHLQHKKSQTTRSAIKNSAMSLICIISIANFDKVRVLHWGWQLEMTTADNRMSWLSAHSNLGPDGGFSCLYNVDKLMCLQQHIKEHET